VSNPLKAFAVCCKIWNHPDVLYNFLKRKEEVDIDFDPEELMVFRSKGAGASSSSSKGGALDLDPAIFPDGKKEEINYDWAQVAIVSCYCHHTGTRCSTCLFSVFREIKTIDNDQK
jgi:hypothetical protein